MSEQAEDLSEDFFSKELQEDKQNIEPKYYTRETLPSNCPRCGDQLRYKMSGRVCDNYPCTFYCHL